MKTVSLRKINVFRKGFGFAGKFTAKDHRGFNRLITRIEKHLGRDVAKKYMDRCELEGYSVSSVFRGSFVFLGTPEGSEYWNEQYYKLVDSLGDVKYRA